MTKLLFEGEGASVRKDLYQQFKGCYDQVTFVVASNALPASEAQGRDQQFHADIWQPIVSRTAFAAMTTTHKPDEVFPYTEQQLAHALMYLCENPEICDELKSEEVNTVPEFKDNTASNKYYAEKETETRDAFEKVLLKRN